MFEIGDLVDDRYRIINTLGHGGMAQVYRAHDQHLDREVALKALRPHLTDADQERFRREIKALARLSHPGIVSIYDLGRGEHVYFALELVEGGPITNLGPLEADLEPLTNFLKAAISVTEALAFVHHHGMVHRDLTPRNILMTTQGQPKVMDFGLVQLAETSRQLTRTGFTLGTPHYMAPEQATGNPIGAHTDLYALGAVLYRTVTGIAPFEAENDQAVLYQHVYGDLEPPHIINPAVPLELSRLIESLLAKDPQQRPASSYRVTEALRALLAQVERSSTQQRLAGPGQLGVFAHGPINPKLLKPAWQIKLPQGPQWPAAITAAEGFLLLGLSSEELAVLRPVDGSIQSRFRVDDEVNSAVVYQDQRLYFVSRGGQLYSLKWPSGEPNWTDSQAQAVGIIPFANSLLVSTSKGLERRSTDNNLSWCYDTENSAVTAPTVHDSQACFVTRGGWLHSVDVKTGKGRFKLELGAVAAQIAAKNHILLLPERSGDLHAFDIHKHEVMWTYDLEGQIWASPLAWQNYVYAVSWANVLHCLSLQSGDDIWKYALDAQVTAAPIIASGILYVATEAGEIIAFDARSGQLLFKDRATLSPVQTSPLVLNGSLIVAAIDGTVRSYH